MLVVVAYKQQAPPDSYRVADKKDDMTYGHTDNPLAKEINTARFRARITAPSVATTAKWHKEYLESGAQYRVSYACFLKQKTRQWRQEKQLRNWTFGCGKFKGHRIQDIIKKNIKYIEWVLENQPKGRVAKQIVSFINNNPGIIK